VAEFLAELQRSGFPRQTGARRVFANVYYSGYDADGGRWTRSHHEHVLSRLSEQDARGMDLSWSVPQPSWYEDFSLASGFHLSYKSTQPPSEDPAGLWEGALCASLGLLRGAELDAAGEIWTGLLRLVGSWPETLWAAVLYDKWEGGTEERRPHERYYGIENGATLCEDRALGYYWANLLTERHLEGLGGAAALRARCDELGLVLEECPGRPGAAVLRAGQPVGSMDDECLAALREALAPVLAANEYRGFYSGPPLRVIKDPGTAFRRVPPEIEWPAFEEDASLSPDLARFFTLVPDE
jgi:hypothetical protein